MTILKFRTKLSYLGIFRLKFEKKTIVISEVTSDFFQNAKFSAKIKILKFETKNT